MMDINGLDYNTLRKKLIMHEYGREVQNMIEHALTIEDREERQVCAETIIATMQRLCPQEGKKEDRMQKLWHHLAIISDFKLDIDYPIDISMAHNLQEKPCHIGYNKENIPIRHYGSNLFKVFEKLKTMPEGPERDSLVEMTTNQMKLLLMQWSHGSADNEKIASDLEYFTDGNIVIDPNSISSVKVATANNRNFDKKKKKK